MSNFWPISLCRVIYKIVAKTLANRLKKVLPSCISQNQSAFVPGRMIHDNILIVHDYCTTFRVQKTVEWKFLETVMKNMGFADYWINLIMKCVCSVKYVVKCNGILTNTITPERGLPQGDPLSPYLFLFCMEAFSRMLNRAQQDEIIRGVQASINGPRINHLFFADDALLFIRNKKEEVETFTKILNDFEKVSGQQINFEKSMVYFSPKTLTARREHCNMLSMQVVDKLNNYFGFPLHIGNKKSLPFNDILNRFSCRINSWSKRLLSYGGREVFIKSILQALPTYAFSIFLTLRRVVEDMNSKIRRMW
ncbi:reverse transcriptase [Gossypium australe]|uniref:Reverse transcriptase n=1 Tax=Gossypium australe TaxID=47621 RepID=A0A5B6X389_9ROSI|nr:reverse transcriptase [Gossypium australe]